MKKPKQNIKKLKSKQQQAEQEEDWEEEEQWHGPSGEEEDEVEGNMDGNGQGAVGEDGAVEFGTGEEPRRLTGRRKAKERELKKKMKAGTFDSMGLSAIVLRAIKRKGFRLPTPIQRRSMPLILQGSDVIGMARTGSGKTAAFVIPMIEKLKAHSPKAGARAVLLAPTRELALQTHKAVREFSRFTDLRSACLVGGDALEAQWSELAANPDILVATPGRLLHHLSEVQGMSLRSVEYCVLDEADRLFEMGFAEQIKEILGKMGDTRQTLLFSATLPRTLADFAAAGLHAPQLVKLDSERRISPDLRTLFFSVRQEDKVAALLHLVRDVLPSDQLTIIFVATRHHCEYLSHLMARENIPAACVFGSMDQTARKIHVAKFRAKKVSLLITTDVAARGIDIPLIDNVINVDFPPKPELFVHRVGRAARMGRSGTAFSLLTRDEIPYLLDLHLFLGKPVSPCPLVPEKEQLEAAAATVQDPDAPTTYGSYPNTLLAPHAERHRAVDAAAPEMSSMASTLSNAFALYIKTRPAASAESVTRAKQLPKEGAHPALLSLMPGMQRVDLEQEAKLAEFTAALRSFRPAATVLEAEISGVKSAHHTMPLLESSAAVSLSTEVMQKKRAAHAAVIQRERQKRARAAEDAAALAAPVDDSEQRPEQGSESLDMDSAGEEEQQANGIAVGKIQSGPGRPSADAKAKAKQAAVTAMTLGDGVLNEGKYRDPGLYISHQKDASGPQDDSLQLDRAAAELQGAVLDLTAEDQEGMQAQRRRWQWDKRKKRYVQTQGTEATSGQAAKRVKTESGAKVTAKDGKGGKGLYQKWVRSQHKKVAASGSMEDGGASAKAAADALASRFDKANRHKSWRSAAGMDTGDKETRRGQQLKSKDQVRKEREKKARRKEWLQQKQQGGGGARNKQAGSDWKPKVKGGVQKPKGGKFKGGGGGGRKGRK